MVRPRLDPDSVQEVVVYTRVDREMKERIKAKAEKSNSTISDTIRTMLRDNLEEVEQKEQS